MVFLPSLRSNFCAGHLFYLRQLGLQFDFDDCLFLSKMFEYICELFTLLLDEVLEVHSLSCEVLCILLQFLDPCLCHHLILL